MRLGTTQKKKKKESKQRKESKRDIDKPKTNPYERKTTIPSHQSKSTNQQMLR